MADADPKTKEVEGEEEDGVDGQDLFFVPKTTLEAWKEMIKSDKKDEAKIKELLEKMQDYEKLDDEEMMIPVDMRGVGQDFESIDDMIAALGDVGAAKAFVDARAYFEENKDKEPEESRAQPMTAKEWKKELENMEGEEEEELIEEEEEEPADEEEEELEGDEQDGEPPAKKSKTD